MDSIPVDMDLDLMEPNQTSSVRIYEPCWFDGIKDLEKYKPGGFHPLNIRDHFENDNRYRVINKLGSGGLATVWPCRDKLASKCIALKILLADYSNEDCFELIKGLNETHLRFVLPVLGPRIKCIWNVFPHIDKLSRRLALQVTQGLAFLHRNGICHGDFRPANILLQLTGFDSITEEDLMEKLREPYNHEILLASGEPLGPSAPKYIIQALGLEDLAYDMSKPPETMGIVPAYCSPELIFHNTTGVGCDLWALPARFMRSLLGKPPKKWWNSWEGRGRGYLEDGTTIFDEEKGRARLKPTTIQELLSLGVEFKVPQNECDVLADLLQQLLKYRPASRITTEAILGHRWFKM
ncbi:kinase-like domain-containing protein [Halenospora varia]|nr:kinase-like domain-containing protein [Halenospora varia]